MADLDFLSTIPIFRFFTRAELEEAEKLFREIAFGRDDVVVKLGDPGDTFYVVLDGELEVWDGSTPPRQTGSLRRGDYFGEMALLQGGKRTATVKVARRARLLSLDKPGFDQLFLTNPKAIEYFARVLSQRLAGVTRGQSIRRATTTVSVASRKGLTGETLVAYTLAAILKDITETEVIYVEVRPGQEANPKLLRLLADDLNAVPQKFSEDLVHQSAGPTVLKIAVPPNLTAQAYGEAVSNLVSKLSDTFSFIVFDLGSGTAGLIQSASDYSDVFVSIVDDMSEESGLAAPRSTRVFRVANLYNATTRPVAISSCEPFVLPYESALGAPTREAAAYVRGNPRSAAGLPLYRLAHKLLGTSIGLALGGGAAFGLAHLGVLQVLERAGVPIDMVSGCSQGSIVSVGYAAGLSVEEMIDIARQLGIKRNFLFASDPTFFTKPGILSGQRFLTMMRPYLRGKESFEQLLIPCRTVATDIETGEAVQMGTGHLETAFRASSSVPMVMAPIRVGDRVLVDGGVADPVPLRAIKDMGADLALAVNVVPPMKRGVETALSYWMRRLNVFNPLSYISDGQDLPNLFDIVMNSMQILQYELGNFKAITADVLINPDLSDFTWIEYYRADELIERGVEAAERALPMIEKQIQARLDPIRQAAPSNRAATGT
ncbi:MAG TPA: patatin-like phospholipase family protein [Candidatus Limnocylindria bacterium]|nr:patatin-like phospholipase family protein [Candidatus Limnocylindria bacterium]